MIKTLSRLVGIAHNNNIIINVYHMPAHGIYK